MTTNTSDVSSPSARSGRRECARQPGTATLDAYRLDLRQWATWLDGNGVDVLSVQPAHI